MKHLLSIIAIATILISCGSEKHDGYTVKGNIKGLESENGMVYLLSATNYMNNTVIDSSELVDGKFEFKGKLESPTMATISGMPRELYLFPLYNTQIKLEGGVANPNSILASGSAQIDECNQYMNESAAIIARINDISTEDMDLIYATQDELFDLDLNFAKSNPDNIAAAYSLSMLVVLLEYDQFYDIYNKMSPELQKSSYGISAKEDAESMN